MTLRTRVRSRSSRRHPPDPAFHDRVHAGRLHVAEHGADASAGQDRVERGGEVRSAIADHELDAACLVAEVHAEVAGLLGGPRPSGMRRDAEDADAPGRALLSRPVRMRRPSAGPPDAGPARWKGEGDHEVESSSGRGQQRHLEGQRAADPRARPGRTPQRRRPRRPGRRRAGGDAPAPRPCSLWG